jgi:hypothetical protein
VLRRIFVVAIPFIALSAWAANPPALLETGRPSANALDGVMTIAGTPVYAVAAAKCNSEDTIALSPAYCAVLDLPIGQRFSVVYEQNALHPNGSGTWVRHWLGTAKTIKVIITQGSTGAVSAIATPDRDLFSKRMLMADGRTTCKSRG